MNTDPTEPTPNAPASPLQFDRAEYTGGAQMTCAICKTPIVGEFFNANNHPICPACRERAGKLQSDAQGTSLAKAASAGLVACAAGFVIFKLNYSILSGQFLGLTSILAGWLVGYAVRWGANGRGGLSYQILAAILAYIAISARFFFLFMDDAGSDINMAVRVVQSFVNGLAYPWLHASRHLFAWIFIGFGIYEAWILNRGGAVTITGPFRAQPTPPKV